MKNLQKIYEDVHYKALFKEFYLPLVHFANTFLNDQEAAEDIAQEMFIQLWEKAPAFDHELNLRAYLYQSIHNKCLNYLRDTKTRQYYEEKASEEREQLSLPCLHSIMREEFYRQLITAIDKLPPQCKKICQLTLEGKKPSEIAREMNLAVETVKKQKKIALKRLQDDFGPTSIFWFILQLMMKDLF